MKEKVTQIKNCISCSHDLTKKEMQKKMALCDGCTFLFIQETSVDYSKMEVIMVNGYMQEKQNETR